MGKLPRLKLIVTVLSLLVAVWAIIIVLFLPKGWKEKVPPRAANRIAIVLDDWGYNTNNLYLLGKIPYPLTIAVLPGLAYSEYIAEQASNKGVEVILHLPMEPVAEGVRLEKDTIMAGMQPEQIREIFWDDLKTVPYAVGISNHMGSKATANYEVMRTVFSEMKKKNLYFLDSMVHAQPISEKLAAKMNIGFAKRDVFLDNINDAKYIEGQIEQLKLAAKKRGFAVGVGHDRETTLEVLAKVMPRLEKEGFQFVFVSDLTR